YAMAVEGSERVWVLRWCEPLLQPARFRGAVARRCVAAIDEFARRLVAGQSLSADDLSVLTTNLSCAAVLGRTLPVEEASVGLALRRTFHEEFAFFFPVYVPWLPLTVHRRSTAQRLADRLLDPAAASADRGAPPPPPP